MIIFQFLIKESAQGAKSIIGYIPWFFVFHIHNAGEIFMYVRFFLIVGKRGTKAHWVNPLQIPKQDYVNVFEKISMYKNSCCNSIQEKGP